MITVRNAMMQGTKKNKIPTYIVIGDSNADGRATPSLITLPYLYSLISNGQPNVKIFDSFTFTGYSALSVLNSMDHQYGNFGFEQTMMYELQKYHNSEVRIIKLGISGDTALDWYSGTSKTSFETIMTNALSTAATEGVTLDFKGVAISLGTNDATSGGTYLTNYTARMNAIISWVKILTANNDLKTVLYQCPLRSTTLSNDTDIRAQQQAIANADSNIEIYDADKLNIGQTHLTSNGYMGIGLEFADKLVTLQGGTSFIANYYFRYNVKRSGTVTSTFGASGWKVETDWGDGTVNSLTTHTYSDNNVYTITQKNTLYAITTGLTFDYVYGQFDASKIDDTTVFVNRTFTLQNSLECTSFIQPGSIYKLRTLTLLNVGIIGVLNLSNFGFYYSEFGFTLDNCDGVTNVVFGTAISGKAVLANIRNNATLQSIDLSWISPTTGVLTVTMNPALTELIMFATPLTMTAATMFIQNNNVLQFLDLSKLKTGSTAVTLRIDNNTWSTAEVDQIINVLYDARNIYTAACTINIGGTNENPSGVYDATTDWSGGLPISPEAKRYDMNNDVTGTYLLNVTI